MKLPIVSTMLWLLAVAPGDASTGWSLLSSLGPPQGPGVEVGVRVQRILVDPADPQRILASTYLDGVYLSEDAGAHWSRRPVGPGVAAIACAEDSVVEYFAVLRDGDLYRSADAGTTWWPTPAAAGSGYVRAMAIAPSDPDRIYLGRTTHIVVSNDRGLTWAQPDSSIGIAVARSIDIDPQHPDTLFAVAGVTTVVKSFDGGATWDTVVRSTAVLDAVRINPLESGIVYVLGEGGILRSQDRGDSWEALPLGLDAFDLAVHPGDAEILYCATGNGVYRSLNGGNSWHGAGLQGTHVWTLTLHEGTLYAGSDLRIYARQLAPAIDADFDTDGKVGYSDFLLFAKAFGKRANASGWEPGFDLNEDGRVDFADLLLLLGVYGQG